MALEPSGLPSQTPDAFDYGHSAASVLDTSVSPAARDKRTMLKGGGQDTATIMVYLCGTDPESRSGMATSDLQEMLNASIGDKVNLIIETGGTKQWKNSVTSNRTNQIYQVTDKGLLELEKDLGQKAMTDPDTLSHFIQYCHKNFPADRYELILWDHGGGSVGGYGYDEHYPNGTMTLDKIYGALEKGGSTFDFIGFDACLMVPSKRPWFWSLLQIT